MKEIALIVCVCLGLIGCVSSKVAKYSEAGDWVGLAKYDVEVGNKPRSSEDLVQLGAIDKEQQENYLSAYRAHVETYCNPDNAFNAGLMGKPRNSVCIDDTPKGWIYKKNWETGREGNSF